MASAIRKNCADIILIPQNGIYILQNMDTRELAKDKADEFMFVLERSRMTGLSR